jgi:hypothetical protein
MTLPYRPQLGVFDCLASVLRGRKSVLLTNVRTYVKFAAFSAIQGMTSELVVVAEKVASTTWRDEPASA